MSGPLMREIANAVGEDMVDLGRRLGLVRGGDCDQGMHCGMMGVPLHLRCDATGLH